MNRLWPNLSALRTAVVGQSYLIIIYTELNNRNGRQNAALPGVNLTIGQRPMW